MHWFSNYQKLHILSHTFDLSAENMEHNCTHMTLYKMYNLKLQHTKRSVADPKGGSGGSPEPRICPPFLNILWKWNNLVSVTPNDFIFMGYLRLESTPPRSGVKHSITEPPHSSPNERNIRLARLCWMHRLSRTFTVRICRAGASNYVSGYFHARETLYSNSAFIACWLQSTSAHNSVPSC